MGSREHGTKGSPVTLLNVMKVDVPTIPLVFAAVPKSLVICVGAMTITAMVFLKKIVKAQMKYGIKTKSAMRFIAVESVAILLESVYQGAAKFLSTFAAKHGRIIVPNHQVWFAKKVVVILLFLPAILLWVHVAIKGIAPLTQPAIVVVR